MIQNNSSCSISPIQHTASEQQDFNCNTIETETGTDNIEFKIKYSGSKNTSKRYFIPLNIECHSELYDHIAYSQNIEITAGNNRLEVTTSAEPFPYPPLQLMIIGQAYIDDNSKKTTIVAQPTSFGTATKSS